MNQETANYIMQRMSKYLDNSQIIKLKDTLDESLRRVGMEIKSILIKDTTKEEREAIDLLWKFRKILNDGRLMKMAFPLLMISEVCSGWHFSRNATG